MILAIDIGNSHIVLGCIENDSILFEARMATDRVRTSDQYCADLKSLLELYKVDLTKIEGTIISSVVPPVLNAITEAVRKLVNKRCYVVGPGLKTGLNIRIDNPAEVGSDLIVAAVAAMKEYGTPLIIIDMGTATTFSVVDQNKAYLGGAICPGVMISLDALTSRTAQLPGISLNMPKRVVGKNTVDCMQSGLFFGAAAMIDGLIERTEEELGYPTTVIATGGLARFIQPLCKREIRCDDDLLLKGLNIIYKLNAKN